MAPIIGVGPIRTGSTWLFNVIASTGAINYTTYKEISFFDKRYGEGFGWYSRQFIGKKPGIGLDVTPHYIDKMEYCERIATHLPDATVILGVRDPMSRIRSIFQMYYKQHKSILLEDYKIQLDNNIERQILIADRVEFLAKAFGNRMIFLRYDDLSTDPVRCARDILARCDIDAAPPATSRLVFNSMHSLKDSSIARGGRKVFRLAKKILPKEVIFRAKHLVGERLLMEKVTLDDIMSNVEFDRIVEPYRSQISADMSRVIKIASAGAPSTPGRSDGVQALAPSDEAPLNNLA